MKKIFSIFLILLLVLVFMTGCSSSKEAESQKTEEEIKEELKEEIKAEMEAEDNEINSEDGKAGMEEKNVESAETAENEEINQENLCSMDFDLLYFMDSDIDFLTMKNAGRPSQDETYYVDRYDSFETRYYLAEDKYTINRITIINDSTVKEDSYCETCSFMGLYLGMPMELAEELVQTSSPDYDGKLEVKYSDNTGDGLINQIDVYSKKELVKRIKKEDFYFKFFDMNIHNEVDHMGDNTGAKVDLEIDKENRTYTYNIVFGEDKYQKVYVYNEKNTIESMEIKSDQDKFLAVVPSLLGIQLGSKKEDLSENVKAADKTIYSSKTADINDSKYNVEEYTIIDNPSKIVYTAEVYIDKVNNKVKKVKGYFKHNSKVSYDDLINTIGKKLEGDPKKTESKGTDNWVVDYEAYSDKIIRSAAIYNTDEDAFINTVPSLCGLELNMFVIGVHNTLVNNGFELLDEERYQPFQDKSYETIKYTVVNTETKKEFKIYITSKYIGDISAAIVVRIAVS